MLLIRFVRINSFPYRNLSICEQKNGKSPAYLKKSYTINQGVTFLHSNFISYLATCQVMHSRIGISSSWITCHLQQFCIISIE